MLARNLERNIEEVFSKIFEITVYSVCIFLLVAITILVHSFSNLFILYALPSCFLIIMGIWFRFMKIHVSPKMHVFFELAMTLIFASGFVFGTGGILSPFMLLLLLPILYGAFFLVPRTNFIFMVLIIVISLYFFQINPIENTGISLVLYLGFFVIVDYIIVAIKEYIRSLERMLISKVDKLTELERLNARKDEFMYITTHELRTPVSVLRGYLDLLSHDTHSTLSPKSKDIFAHLVEHTDRLSTIVEDLLDISRIETGKLDLHASMFDLSAFIKSLIDELAVDGKDKQVILEYQNEGKENLMIESDKDRLREVLVNLIDNAIKYSKKNGKVVIATRVVHGRIEISVKDNGIGIPVEDQSKIFQKFFRAKNVYSIATHGTGLGLYIVYRLMDLLKGYIQFSSEENKGSIFRIELPLQ